MSGLSMLALDRHRRNGYSIESFVVNQRGSPVGIKKKIKKELIGTSDYPSNKIFTISNFITFTRLIRHKQVQKYQGEDQARKGDEIGDR